MQQPSARTCLLLGSGIAGAVLGTDLVRLAVSRRISLDQLRYTALAAAAVLTAVGLSSRHTRLTLDLARRLERARVGEPPGTAVSDGLGRNGPGRTVPLPAGPVQAAPAGPVQAAPAGPVQARPGSLA